MDLSDLRIFTAVVREGGITRAAKRLHRVQSNVTTRIRQLEEELEVGLFVREGKRLKLAPAGRILLDYADRLLTLSEEAEAAVRDFRPRGLLRIGAMESTAAVRLPDPLAAYSKRYPEARLELQTGNPTQLANSLINGDIDAAFVAEPVNEAKFDWIVAFEEEPVIVASSDHVTFDKKDALPATILVFEQGCPHRRQLEEWYASRRAVPERIVELRSYHAMLGCVLAGMGAALLPRSVLTTFPKYKSLQIYDLPRGKNRLRTLLIWRKGIESANVKALAEILVTRSC